MVSPEQWPKIKQIVADALELEAEGRQSFLARACGADSALRNEIESLLAAHAKAGDLSRHPLAFSTVESFSSETTIGPYRLIRELGVGGMGQVWLAQQNEPVRRQVALKLIRAGFYDEALVQRFQAERQSLALMEHPAIARVFDAGASNAGQPFFAMEYVDGLPITEYCDHKQLTIPERLRLLLLVCGGVQHAHQKAIIHRDLKPSNILVAEIDGKPAPRIIDFGLAKLTSPTLPGETMFTQAGAFLGTPGYMSPEQADPAARDIDTRSDVYSLGVILYELLTGFLPFDSSEWKKLRLDEVIRQLRETDPQRPSNKVSTNAAVSTLRAEARGTEPRQLATSLRGDLDWITLKALEKDRERRYATPSALAADIERYLEGKPIEARPASPGYRLSKYVRRNRIAVAIAASALAVLIAFAAMQALELRRITRERDRADRITRFMTKMFEVSDPSEARGNSVTAREILDKSSQSIDAELGKDPEMKAQMKDSMARVYESLGLYGRAQILSSQAVEIRRVVLGVRNPATLSSLDELAWIFMQQGRYADSEKLQTETLDVRRRTLGVKDPDTLASMSDLASTLNAEGRYADAEKLERETLTLQRSVLGPEAEDTLTSMNNLANSLAYQSKYEEAEKLRRETLAVQSRVFGPEFPGTLRSMSNLADTLFHEARFAEAEKLQRQVLEIERRVLGPEHPETLMSMYNLAADLNRSARYDEAQTLGRQTLDARSRVLGAEHPKTLLAMVGLATTLMHQGKDNAAEELLLDALKLQQRWLVPRHPDIADTLYKLAVLKQRQGKKDESVALLRQAVDGGLSAQSTIEMQTDPDLHGLSQDSRFRALLAELKTR